MVITASSRQVDEWQMYAGQGQAKKGSRRDQAASVANEEPPTEYADANYCIPSSARLSLVLVDRSVAGRRCIQTADSCACLR